MASFFAPGDTNIRPGRCHNVDVVPHQGEAFRPAQQVLEGSCPKFNIRNCTNQACLDERLRLETIAPDCKWTHFRDWVMVVVSCVSTSGASNIDQGTALSHALDWCREGYLNIYHHHWATTVHEIEDPFGVYDLLYWMMPLGADARAITAFFEGHELEVPAIRCALEELSCLGICQRRLWNLIQSSHRGIIDLPSLVPVLRRLPDFHHKKHEECTPDMCYFDDDNTTTVEQQHKNNKCEHQKCDPIYFDPVKLDDRIKIPRLPPSPQNEQQQQFPNSPFSTHPDDFDVTAWSVHHQEPSPSLLTAVSSSLAPRSGRRRPRKVGHVNSYMAISHVWSDGTGQGSHRKGDVNQCLFDFFADIARKPPINCDGIWWDTICMPSDREKRALAIERMHQNYARAGTTLVHDEELLKIPWSEDGSPCLALVLSTWFTRGWTALELKESPSVKVLFNHPEEDGFVVKDLDKDILAHTSLYSTPLAHRIASNIVRRMRRNPDPVLVTWTDTVATLRSRYTSWARDLWIIACLMERIEGFDSTWSKAKMTRSILLRQGIITGRALLHGQTTISDSGPWSWCPISILNLQNSTIGMVLRVEKEGAVVGKWACRRLRDATDVHRLPAHMSVKLKIDEALQNRNKCLLLKPMEMRNLDIDQRCLLVMNMGIRNDSQEKEARYCQYIGTVEVQLPAKDETGDSWKAERIRLSDVMEGERRWIPVDDV